MKIGIKLLLIISLFTAKIASLTGQCMIAGVTAEVTACEGAVFDVSISFEFENVSNTFVLTGNGTTYGTFEYGDLPVVITSLAADCEQEYEFVVMDSVFDDCSDFDELGIVCCSDGECEITTLDLGPNPVCEDGLIVTQWLIDGVNLSEVGFDIFINDEFQTFVEYDSGNWYDFDLQAPNTEGFVLKVCDNDNADCCFGWDMENPCYDPSANCNITLFEVQGELECAEPNVPYGTWLIEGTNLSETSFEVYLEGDFLWTMQYEETGLYLQEFEVANTEYFVVTICDTEFPDCCISNDFLNPCYVNLGECEITTLDFGPDPVCEDGLVVTEWLIDGVNLSEVGFDIFINNEFQTFVEYNEEHWYDFDIEAPDTQNFVIKVCDNDNADCCIVWELENPCFDGPMQCQLGELDLELVFCDEGVFAMSVDFEYASVSDSFELRGNGVVYGYFAYIDLPVTIEAESDCDLDYEFIVIDSANPNCQAEIGYGNICCDEDSCELWDLVLNTSECDGGSFVLQIDFNYANTTNASFDYEILGITSGFAAFEDLPLSITIENATTAVFDVFINENDNADCVLSGTFENPCYEQSGDCEITTLDFGPNPVCEEGLIVTQWLIDGVNLSEVGFDIFINNEFQTFVEYNEEHWYDFDIEAPNTQNFAIKVCDNDNADCCIVWELENPCFDGPMQCQLGELDLELVFCDDGVFAMSVDFEYTSVSDSFELRGNGVVYGYFAYIDLPVTIEAESDCDLDYEFIVIDSANPNCQAEIGYGNICCDEEGLLGGLTWVGGDSEEEFYLQVDFNFDAIDCGTILVYGQESIDTLTAGDQMLIGPFPCGSSDVLTLTFENGCTGQDLFLEVIDLTDFPCIVGVEDELQLAVDVRIVGSELTIYSAEAANLVMTLISIDAAVVTAEQIISSGTTSYDITGLNSGIYVVHIIDLKTALSLAQKIPILK